MNRSVLKMSVLAPLAVVLTAAMAATPARADAGPAANLVKDAIEKTLPAQVADTAHPTAELPASTVRGVLKTARGLAEADKAGARSRLGRGVLRTAHGDVAFDGITARCGSELDGVLEGTTTITRGQALTGALRGLPLQPPANYRLPAPSTGEIESIVLNKQVRGAAKDLTVTAVSLIDESGESRDYGVARCPNASRMAARRPAPVPAGPAGPAAALTGSVLPTVNDLVASQLGEMPAVPDLGATGLAPADPAAPPRPTRRAATPGPADAAAQLPAGLAGTATGLAKTVTDLPGGGLSGSAVPSPAGLLGGTPGLPLVG